MGMKGWEDSRDIQGKRKGRIGTFRVKRWMESRAIMG
jgi:hypothetical protein